LTELPGGRAAGNAALQRCVGNVTEFVDRYWTRAPLHRPAADELGFADLLSLRDVDDLLSTASFGTSVVRLVKSGRPLDLETYTTFGRVGSKEVTDLVDPGRVYVHSDAGVTIVLQSLHRHWLPLTRFCRELELALTHPIQENAYITPQAARP